jgi:DNA-binding protein HU-beta
LKTKAQLIAALAERTGLTRRDCARAYDALVALVETHAAEGVNLPGLCRFRIVDRKARTVRDPRTGQRFLVKAHKAVTVRVPKAVRLRLAPLPPDCRVPAPEPAAPPPPPAPAPALAAAPTVWVTFACRACGTGLEASADMRGQRAICPACKAAVLVPLATEPVAPAATPSPVPPTPGAPAPEPHDLRSTTMRIELPDLGGAPGARPRKFVVPRYRGS